jgi:hypothetical protein
VNGTCPENVDDETHAINPALWGISGRRCLASGLAGRHVPVAAYAAIR